MHVVACIKRVQYLDLQFASYDLDPICTPISSKQCTTMIVVANFFREEIICESGIGSLNTKYAVLASPRAIIDSRFHGAAPGDV